MPNENGAPIWQDFPAFYNNPTIQKLAEVEGWTVSSTKKEQKVPLDIYGLIHYQRVWGLAFDRGYNPLIDLKTLCEFMPTAANNTFYLDCLRDNVVVLDIEPSCPEALKQKFLQLPYLYGEKSMSGHGLHLIFQFPADILDKYPNAKNKQALKHESGYYEILLNHLVTFTRNDIPLDPNHTGTEQDFRNLFDTLASIQKESVKADAITVDTLVPSENIPKYDQIMMFLSTKEYAKTPADFNNDRSRYEFGIAGYYHMLMQKALRTYPFNKETYTEPMIATMIYTVVIDKLEARGQTRAKHETLRNGMPFLLYIVTNVMAKSDIDKDTKQKKGDRKNGKVKKEKPKETEETGD